MCMSNPKNWELIKIALTYPTTISGEVNRIQSLMDGDFDVVHLRKPEYSREMMMDLIRSVSPDYHNRLVIHSHYDLCDTFGIKGIAISNRNLVEEGKQVWGQYPVVSYSAHSFREIEYLTGKPDYILLSPIFDSISKVSYRSEFNDHQLLRAFLSRSEHNIIALGGVDESKIKLISDLGFAGYAQLGNIWQYQTAVV